VLGYIMKLTVLGCYGPFPSAGGTCSGYLLEQDGYAILLDCGNGVLSNLQYFVRLDELSAVIISHLHSDHISDLFILRHALSLSKYSGLRTSPLKIYSPAEPAAEYDRLFLYKDQYDIEVINEKKRFEIGPFLFSFLHTVHSIPSYAISVLSNNRNKLVYSSDTEYFPQLSSFAEDASLFLCESTFLSSDLQKGAINHLSAKQAAKLAFEGQVKQLLLTHFLPYNEHERYHEEATAIFPATELAKENSSYQVNSV